MDPTSDLQSADLANDFAFAFAPVGTASLQARHHLRPTNSQLLGAAPATELSLERALEWFQRVVTHPQCPEVGARETGTAIEVMLARGASIDAATSIGIYHRAYRARLTECLADDYPALVHAMGAERFAEVADAYITRFPSRSTSLNCYGQHMPAFCAELTDAAAPFWSDLARLEWALVEAVHAPDALPLEATALAKIPPDSWSMARLVPHETLRLLRFSYHVNTFYKSFWDNELERTEALALPSPQVVAVFRQGGAIWRMELTPLMALLLESLLRGHTLGRSLAAVEEAIACDSELQGEALDVSGWFSRWLENGFFQRVELEGVTP